MTNEEFIKNISFDGEEWRDVVGFEGLYMVSSFGRVASKFRFVDSGSKSGGLKDLTAGIKALQMTNSGYFQVRLYKSNKESHRYVHKLVAESFIPNPNNYQYVDHVDTNRLNNMVKNPRWCTNSMNVLNPITRSKRHETIKRDPKSQRWIMKAVVRVNMNNSNDIKHYESVGSTSNDGYNPSSVSAVCRGDKKSYRGYKWFYEEDYKTLTNMSKNDICQSSN